jgi:carbon starvation protein CstA
MNVLLLVLGSAALLVGGYFTYGRWLSRAVFRLSPTAPVPSVELRDDVD